MPHHVSKTLVVPLVTRSWSSKITFWERFTLWCFSVFNWACTRKTQTVTWHNCICTFLKVSWSIVCFSGVYHMHKECINEISVQIHDVWNINTLIPSVEVDMQYGNKKANFKQYKSDDSKTVKFKIYKFSKNCHSGVWFGIYVTWSKTCGPQK